MIPISPQKVKEALFFQRKGRIKISDPPKL